MAAKFAGALPKGATRNGLLEKAAELVANPYDVHVAVIFFDVAKVTKDVDSGLTVPTARILRIEMVDDPADGNRLRQILRRAWERRTGEAVLPIEMEDELTELFGRPPAQQMREDNEQ